MHRLLLLVLLLCVLRPLEARSQTAVAPDPREAAFVDSLLALMTVEEKLGQLTQYTGRWTVTGPSVPQGGEDDLRAGRIGSFLNIIGAEVTRDIQHIAVDESRLGIPLLFGQDVIHGFRTIFPVPLAEAATWNPEAAEHAAHIAAREAASAGVHWTFAPMVDLARDARWSRIVEGSGEDPYLGSVMAAARVRGFQGTSLRDPQTVLATAKHFVAYGGAEGGRDYNTVDISERTLREIYLPPFKASVDAGVQSVMAAFNEVGGEPATGSYRLLTEILRQEWGFDGLVVSDYTGVWELMQHGVAADSAEAGRRALTAGVDMNMVDGIYIKTLPPLVGTDRLPLAVVDEATRRVLRAKYRLGLFEDPYRYNDPDREATTLLAPEHRAAARAVAQQAIVLLKNDRNVLPLAKDLGTLAVIGALAADSLSALGSWAAAGRPADAIPILAGLQQAVPETRILYAPGYPAAHGSFDQIVDAMFSEDTQGVEEAVRIAREADAVVLVLGEHRELTGEAAGRTSIDLPGIQPDMARRVIEAAGDTPVVVLLMNGRPLAIPYLADAVPAILETWYLGTEMGLAVADVLFGDTNPSGKLPVTFPRTAGQEPLYYNHKPTGRPPSTDQKYTSKYIDVPWTPLYPFGFGLSYTTFTYDHLRLHSARISRDGTLTVTVDVTNTGDRTGTEVVQLYVRDEVASVTRPVKELRGFAQVPLQPGDTQTVTFTLGPEDLALYDLDMQHVVEPGFFTIYVGPNSVEGLEARFEVIE